MFHQVMQFGQDHVVLVGVTAAVILPMCLAFILRSRWRPIPTLREKVEGKVGGVKEVDIDRMLNWLPQDGQDRRRSPRRGGAMTPIYVTLTPTIVPAGVEEGLVLDRATGGLCFAVERPFEVGEIVYLKVTETAPDFPWVAATVRHCRDHSGYFLIGCEFQETLPLALLLQFG